MTRDERMEDEAIAWAVRTGDPAFADWDAFTAWLAADPAHAGAHDRVQAGLADVTALDLPPPAGNDDGEEEPASPSWRRWLALAASVALVAVFGYAQWRGGSYSVETAPGEMRTVALADGSSVTLAGGTRLAVARSDARSVRLEEGEALFSVRHNAAHPFVVRAGGQELVDAGTVFNVAHDGGEMVVAVAEGAVVVNPAGKSVRLGPGQQLAVADRTTAYRMGTIALQRVGEWREGRLTFDGAALSAVAADLTRATGLTFVAAPAVAGRTVSGSVLVAPVKADPQGLGELFGVRVRRDGERWIIDRP
jgi:transmembrane sensor